jgi:hypothetical protein
VLGDGHGIEVSGEGVERLAQGGSLHRRTVPGDGEVGFELRQALDRGFRALPVRREVLRWAMHFGLLAQHGIGRLLIGGDEGVTTAFPSLMRLLVLIAPFQVPSSGGTVPDC